MLRPLNSVNFTGIKNIGHTKSYSKSENGTQNVKYTLNMQLTDDRRNQDLSNYYQIINENPRFFNTISPDSLNVEVNYYTNKIGTWYIEKINGVPVKTEENNFAIRKLARHLVNRISKFKPQEFKQDPFYKYTNQAEYGLIQNEDILDYIDQEKGELDILEGTGFSKKYREFCQKGNFNEADLMKLFKAKYQIIDCLHNHQYVKNGAIIMDSLLKSSNKLNRN